MTRNKQQELPRSDEPLYQRNFDAHFICMVTTIFCIPNTLYKNTKQNRTTRHSISKTARTSFVVEDTAVAEGTAVDVVVAGQR